MHTFLYILACIIVGIIALLALRTFQLELGSEQTRFSRGTAETLPEGLYAGSVDGPKVSWLGKKFTSEHYSGINMFRENDGSTSEKYPFVLSLGPGVHDNHQVIQIDYNTPTNPWWLRPILDEIVEIAPGQYLGKLQYRIIPFYPFTLTYFSLTKQ